MTCKLPFDGRCTLSRERLKPTIIYSKQQEVCSFVRWKNIAKDLLRLVTVLVYSRPLHSKQQCRLDDVLLYLLRFLLIIRLLLLLRRLLRLRLRLRLRNLYRRPPKNNQPISRANL